MSQGKKPAEEPCIFVPSTDLYDHIPKSHFYEQLNKLLKLDFIYEQTRPLYAHGIGRPSLDPVVFFKSMIVMFFENILYFTELEYRLADSLTLHRFLGYSLNERMPDESTLRKTFQKMPAELFEMVFEHVLDLCHEQGLIKGETITTDSTLIEANASLESLTHRELGCTSRDFFMALHRENKVPQVHKKDKSDDSDVSGKPKGPGLPQNEIWNSTTDLDAKVMSPRNRHTHLYHRADVGVDMDTGIILSAGAEVADVSDQMDFLIRVDEATGALESRGYTPTTCVADGGHLSAPNLIGLEERGLISMITDRPQNYHWAPGFGRDDFQYDAEQNVMVCPEGQTLSVRFRGTDHTIYRCKGAVCRACTHFGVCTRDKNGRRVKRSDYELYFKANAERNWSEEGRALRWSRMQRGEAPFSYFKGFGGLRRIACRGLDLADKKIKIAGLCWNLLKLAAALASGAYQSLAAVLWALLGLLRSVTEAIINPTALQSATG